MDGNQYAFMNPDLPVDQRVDDLVSRLTLEEKIAQMVHGASPIERLGIPAYNWWNEGLHGVARAGHATVFPQAIGIAAAFDRALMEKIGRVTADEARAKHHHALREGNHEIYYGLTFWSPNINIFRDPRWGRGHETFGEDPYLTGEMGLVFVRQLQGDDPTYLKLVATAKHFAVHSGPEKDRHWFDAVVSKKDMEETYLPAFRKLMVDGKAYSIMGAYNRTNGEVCCASPTLLGKILREKWGFQGYVVSDCWAIDDFYKHHKIVETPEQAAAMAVKNGCDLNCGSTYFQLRDAVAQALITEADIDRAVKRLFTARMKLGMFDPPERVPFAQIPYDVVGCTAHRKVSLQAARESIVLLKNDGLLPLDRERVKNIAVIGPNANEVFGLIGNYCGSPSRPVTPLAGLMHKLPRETNVVFERGCDIHRHFSDGVMLAKNAVRNCDVAVVCLGLTAQFEGEEGCSVDADMGGDRRDIALYTAQQELLEEIVNTGKPVVLVLMNGSAVALEWAARNVPAIIEAWYPGEEGGTAIADVIFGDYNPAGRLPVTFYRSVGQLPPFEDYSMTGRTYRYMTDEPLYPFGFGLSYTTFAYSDLKFKIYPIRTGQKAVFGVNVKNTGERAGDEVVQVYIHAKNAPVAVPRFQLVEFARVSLKPGQEKTVTFTLPQEVFSVVTEEGKRVQYPGEYEMYIGGCSPARGAPITTTIQITGDEKEFESSVA